jgi:poly(3-hydroxybutyrate) depolymerase
MSFQAYLDNIKAKTGKTPADFKRLAEQKGFMVNGELNATTNATEITNWLKEEFELGHGHAMAILASLKGKIE